MKSIGYLSFIAAVCLWWAQPASGQPAAGAPSAAVPAGAEVLTRGPVHEAFAQPASMGAARTIEVPKKPPEAIDEIPPDSKPADENAVWISGYWGWDDDRKDFLWVSGVWRVPPPGQRWVAGYWTPVSGGFQWVPGFWNPVTNQEVEYFPEPPASLEQGPTSDAPSSDYVWIPGCWRWRDARYAWQPGYWAIGQSNWVWTPASYYWCPRGWVFCDGHWDYPLASRGLLFAPIRFGALAYRERHSFSPSVVIDAGNLSFYLFARPSYCHYYFGDYYAASYDGLGIFPWFGVGSFGGYRYDPLFSFYRWRNRTSDPQWLANLQGWHTYYRQHADQRPPQTLSAQQQLLATATKRPDRNQLAIADTLTNVGRIPNAFVQLTTVPVQERVRLKESARLTEQFRTQRAQLESETTAAGRGSAGASVGMGPGATLKAPLKLAMPKLPTLGSAQGATPRIGARPETPALRTPGPIINEGVQPANPGRSRIMEPNLTPKPNIVPQPNVVPHEPRVIPREAPRTIPHTAPQVIPHEAPRIEKQPSVSEERGDPRGGKGEGRERER